MNIIKTAFLWIVLTIFMMVSWSAGITAGNAITQSSPPPLADPSSVAIAFLAVCIVNSLLLSLVVWQTRSYEGALRWMTLVLYVWTVQFLLAQMETFFFVRSVAMSTAQILSIVIGGAVMSLATVSGGTFIAAKMNKADPKQRFSFTVTRWSTL